MNFDPSIGLGSILVIVTMTVGGLGAFFTLRGDAKESGKRIGDLEKGHGDVVKRLTDFELSVARDAKEYVSPTRFTSVRRCPLMCAGAIR